MWKNKLYEIISEYGNKITTIGIFLFVMIMVITVKTYMNYSTIIQEIARVKTDIEQINEEIAYSENFYKAYLDSEYAPYFLAHKNNTLFHNEMIIRFNEPYDDKNTNADKEPENTKKDTITSYTGVTTMTPQQSRQNFIKSKINN